MLNQMLIFGLLIAVGVIVRKQGILNVNNLTQISALLVNYAIPAVILSSITGDDPHLSGSELLHVCGAVFLTMALMLLNFLSALALGYRKALFIKPLVCLSTFTSIAMIGVPLIYALYGPDTLIYVTVVLLISNLLFFTFGFWCLGDPGRDYSFSWRKVVKFFNPGVIACLLALSLYIADWRLPYILETALLHLGSMTAPLSMLLIGAFMCDVKWKEALLDVRVWGYTVLKMLVVPLTGMYILAHLFDNVTLLAVLLATIATPAGAAAPAVIVRTNSSHEVYLLSLKAVAFTTMASVLTLPFVEWVSRSF